MNNIFDVKTDWPIEQRVLNQVIRSKYANNWITETFEITDEEGNLFVTEAISTITSLNIKPHSYSLSVCMRVTLKNLHLSESMRVYLRV